MRRLLWVLVVVEEVVHLLIGSAISAKQQHNRAFKLEHSISSHLRHVRSSPLHSTSHTDVTRGCGPHFAVIGRGGARVLLPINARLSRTQIEEHKHEHYQEYVEYQIHSQPPLLSSPGDSRYRSAAAATTALVNWSGEHDFGWPVSNIAPSIHFDCTHVRDS